MGNRQSSGQTAYACLLALFALPSIATAATINDVALQQNGWLVGHLSDASGQSLAGQPVQISQGSEVLASTVTGADGSFSVHGLRGGCYLVESSQGVRCCRVWAAGTAPPNSQAVARLSPEPPSGLDEFRQRAVNSLLQPGGPPREGNPGGNGHGNGPVGGQGHSEHGNGKGIGHHDHGLGHGYGHSRPVTPCCCD